MRRFELAAVMAALLAAPAALAQESGMVDHSGHMAASQDHSSHMTDLSILPQGCQDAIQQSEMLEMMQGMDMSGMMRDMDEAQKASMQA